VNTRKLKGSCFIAISILARMDGQVPFWATLLEVLSLHSLCRLLHGVICN